MLTQPAQKAKCIATTRASVPVVIIPGAGGVSIDDVVIVKDPIVDVVPINVALAGTGFEVNDHGRKVRERAVAAETFGVRKNMTSSVLLEDVSLSFSLCHCRGIRVWSSFVPGSDCAN